MAARDIVKKYPGRATVLDGVSFSAGKREFVTILGRSGSGKTTLLNILGGLDRPTSGDVEVDGSSIVGLSEDKLAKIRLDKIGFVFQDYNLLFDLTVRENVALPTRLSKKTVRKEVEFLVEELGIKHIADEKPNAISGGEAQRVAIARAMINEPKIILADEPTGNLDDENTSYVIEAFRLVMRDFGTTIVLATHDRDLGKHSTFSIMLEGGRGTAVDPGTFCSDSRKRTP